MQRSLNRFRLFAMLAVIAMIATLIGSVVAFNQAGAQDDSPVGQWSVALARTDIPVDIASSMSYIGRWRLGIEEDGTFQAERSDAGIVVITEVRPITVLFTLPQQQLAQVNAARATRSDLTPLTDPGSATARQDLLFRERAFWFWGTAHRTGDLRRLVRQYGRAANAVWPTGSYFKGGTFGTDVTLVPSQAEQNNPDYKGCTDKNA